jgi:hypothetical protein
MKISRLIAIGAVAVTVAVSSQVMALDASSLKLKVSSVMMSTSPLCTSPVTIFSSTVPVEVDFLAAPTLGSGNPADGTYQCIIIKMSDNIKFTPSTSSGSCIGGTEYVADVCRSDNSGTTRAPDSLASATSCTGNGTTAIEDTVYLYLTTNTSAGTGGNTFLQPATFSSTDGINLTAPLVISGSARSKFVVNATGKVDGSSSSCGMNPPIFGFVKL